jgi:hypothetical protein
MGKVNCDLLDSHSERSPLVWHSFVGMVGSSGREGKGSCRGAKQKPRAGESEISQQVGEVTS